MRGAVGFIPQRNGGGITGGHVSIHEGLRKAKYKRLDLRWAAMQTAALPVQCVPRFPLSVARRCKSVIAAAAKALSLLEG
jgi:hypothetical protein